MSWLSDFIKYLDAFFSGGPQYREEWIGWRLSPVERNDIGKAVDNDELKELDTSKIEAENAHIKTEIDSSFSCDNNESTELSLQKEVQETDVSEAGKRENISDGNIINVSSENSEAQESYDRLLSDCADIIKELDSYNAKVSGEEAKAITETIPHHLIEAIANGSVETIDDNITEFNILLHTPMPVRPVAKGTPIKEYLRPGIKIGNKVLIKAIVKV